MATLPDLLKEMVAMQGSDLHLSIGSVPQTRVHGELEKMTQHPELTPTETKSLSYAVLTDAQKKRFEETKELDFSFGIRGLARFRCNMFNQKGAVGAVYRQIPEKIRPFDELGLPAGIPEPPLPASQLTAQIEVCVDERIRILGAAAGDPSPLAAARMSSVRETAMASGPRKAASERVAPKFDVKFAKYSRSPLPQLKPFAPGWGPIATAGSPSETRPFS